MQIKRLAALSLAAIFTAGMLTGCPWEQDDAASSDLLGSSSGSTSQGGGSGDTGNTTPTPTEPQFSITTSENGRVTYTVTKNPDETYSVTFTITPNAGYIVDDTVMVGSTAYSLSELGVTPDANGTYTYTANNVSAGTNTTVTVTFKDKGYTVSPDGKTYTVSSADGLLAWNAVAQNNLSLNCTLTDDINLSGKTWTPIGHSDYGYGDYGGYAGIFDGQGHTISGLTVNTPAADCVGLFGYVGLNGTVENLNLEIASISGNCRVGGVAGQNDGTITGCMVSGGVSGNDYVGGMVGDNYGTITGCMVSGGSVTAINEDAFAGGVAGDNTGAITGCCFAGDHVTGGIYAGGIVGYNSSGSGKITSCYWQKGPNAAVGNSSGADGCTLIGEGGTTLNAAISAMNQALTEEGCPYRFKQGANGPEIVLADSLANILHMLL